MMATTDWSPLERVLTVEQAQSFMWMGYNADLRLTHYKHVDTRRYLNIDEDGRFHAYDNGRYVAVSKEAAMAHVFA